MTTHPWLSMSWPHSLPKHMTMSGCLRPCPRPKPTPFVHPCPHASRLRPTCLAHALHPCACTLACVHHCPHCPCPMHLAHVPAAPCMCPMPRCVSPTCHPSSPSVHAVPLA